MPIYEYRCEGCGQVVEVLEIGSHRPEVSCPRCGGTQMRKLMSAASFTFAQREPGRTCCGRTERCEHPPCEVEGTCWRRR